MSGGGLIRRSMPFGAAFLVSALFLACSSASSTAAPANGNGDRLAGLPAEPAAPTGAPVAGATGGDNSSVTGDAGLYIVRTGTLEVEVPDVDAAITKGRDLITAAGGYVSASNETTKGDQHLATITYRIPVDKWQDTITSLRAVGTRVIGETTQADEVTAQVVDLNARIDNARASEASIRDIMSRAGTITDVLAVQAQLQSVQDDIERMVAQQQDLTGRAALGTLAVSWETPVVAAVQEVQSGWNFGQEIDRALAQTVNAGQALASLLIWLVIVGLPVFGPMIVIALLVLWFWRRYQRRHPRPAYATWAPVPAGYAMAAPAGPAAPAGWYPPASTTPSAGPAPVEPNGDATAPTSGPDEGTPAV